MAYRITRIDWGNRNLPVRFEADVDGRRVLEGSEQRGLFVMSGEHMTAADVAQLRHVVER